MAAGMPYQQASEAAAMEGLRAWQATINPPRGPDGRIVLDADEAAFDASMADAMGQGNLAAADSEFEMDPVMPYRTAPGRVSMATGEADPGMELQDPRAIAEYRTRVPASEATDEQMAEAGRTSLYAGGQFLPSPEDLAMYQRGQVYTINPATGARGYSPAVPQGPVGFGEPGRLGRRIDLEQPVIDSATGQPIPGSHKYDKGRAESPFGQVEVYTPSPKFRQQLDAREATLRRERLVRAAGPAATDDMDLDQLRAAGRNRREDDRDVRQAEVTRRAMERQNPTALMDPEWRQYVSAVRILGPKAAGPSPSAIQAAELAGPPGPPDQMAPINAATARENQARLLSARQAGAQALGYPITFADGLYPRHVQVRHAIMMAGVTAAEADQIMAELYPNGVPAD
jgi:hypothetical protein